MIHLGIDYGTANTRISLYDGSALPGLLRIGRLGGTSEMIMPSSCWIDQIGRVVVGEETLARPNRLKFIKRFWQDRPEDASANPWRGGSQVISGRSFKCEELVEEVIGEALSRAFTIIGPEEVKGGFTANVVCPVEFDRQRRLTLLNILARRGAKAITLGNIIDEPLAAAILYGRLEAVPPIKQDILVFDAGAGTVDVAVVRYEDDAGSKRMTVLAEAGRCRAGADLDGAMEGIVSRKLMQLTDAPDLPAIYRAYAADLQLGKVRFEEECEQLKMELSRTSPVKRLKPDFLGKTIELTVTVEEFVSEAARVLWDMEDAARSVLKMAKLIVEDFEGIHLLVLVGGTSQLPFVRDRIAGLCPSARVVRLRELDEMFATVRGVGFDKDFRDLIVLRPPYSSELRVTERSGRTRTIKINEAFDGFDKRQFFLTSVPSMSTDFEEFPSGIAATEVWFIGSGEVLRVPEEELPSGCFAGAKRIRAKLTIGANLVIETDAASRTIRTPYFSQVGLKPPRPYRREDLNLPEVLPAEN